MCVTLGPFIEHGSPCEDLKDFIFFLMGGVLYIYCCHPLVQRRHIRSETGSATSLHVSGSKWHPLGCEGFCFFPSRAGWLYIYIYYRHPVVQLHHIKSEAGSVTSLRANDILWVTILHLEVLRRSFASQPVHTPGSSGALAWHWVQSLLWTLLGWNQYILGSPQINS